MVTRWRLLATVLGVTTGFAACAQGEDTHISAGSSGGGTSTSTTTSTSTSTSSTTSTSGTGGGAGGGMGGGTSASGGAGGAGGGPALVCGVDGGINPGEDCNGTNLGGATCKTLGFGSGTLTCDSICGYDTSGCIDAVNCLAPTQDCLVAGCVGMPGCVDSCTPALAITCPGMQDGDNTDRPSTESASCSSAKPGSEEIFQVTASMTGIMSADVTPEGFANYSVSVRTTCTDVTTELACSNTPNEQLFGDFVVGVPVTMGQTYFVVVQGMTVSDIGPFTLTLDFPSPETVCDDFVDNDFNGYTDCDDPNCQATSTSCVPGTVATGQACTQNPDCAATLHNPVCMDANDFPQFPNGYCSEFCNAATACPTGTVCYAGLNISKDGVCLQSCTTNADCRISEGYACVSRGLSTNVCMITPEILCDDYIDNDFNGLTDCADPNCQTLTACVPGTVAVGQPCSLHGQCTASAGVNNPFCLDDNDEGYPNGYCSHFCNPANANECGTGNACVLNDVINANICMVSCTVDSQCRVADGYSCLSGVCDFF